MKLGIAGAMCAGAVLAYCGLAIGIASSGCSAGLTDADRKFRDEYIVDEQACVAKRKAGVLDSAGAFDCVCNVMARRGRPCDVPGKAGGT